MLNAFRRDDRGAIALKFAIVLLPLLALGGGAADMATRAARAAELQDAADAAALAAASGWRVPDAVRISAGRAAFAANITNAAPVPAIRIDGRRAEVAAATEVPAAFLRLVGLDRLPVRAKAVAVRDGEPVCLLLLEENDTGLHMNAGSRLAAECGVAVNSRAARAVYANAHSVAHATPLCVAGGAHTNAGSRIEPAAEQGCSPTKDPLANLPAPADRNAPCLHQGLNLKTGETRTLSPGVYCGGLDLGSGASARLQPGVYVVRDGELRVNARSHLSGHGVMIFLDGDRGRIDFNAHSTVTLSPPASGVYKGVTIYQSREATGKNGEHRINAGSGTAIEGVVYLPKGELRINAHSEANGAAGRALFIVRRLELNAHSVLRLRVDEDGPTPWPDTLGIPPRRSLVRLVS